MTFDDLLLLLCAEECLEIGQRGIKALRFGMDEVQNGQTLTNVQRLLGELNDLHAVIEMLRDRGLLPEMPGDDRPAIEAKKMKVMRYAMYSRDLGRVTGPI